MISYYFKSVRNDEVQVLDEYRPGAWISVEHPTEKEIVDLSSRFQLDIGDLEDALDEDEMPRLERDGEMAYIYIRHVYNSEENEPATSPLLIIVGPELFITIAYRSFPRLEKFLQNNTNYATTQRTKLMLLLMDEVVDQYEVFLNKVSRRIQIIRSRLRSHSVAREDFVDFVTIEDELNEFVSALQPMSAILRRLSLGKYVPIYEQDKDLIEDLLLNNEQSIETSLSSIKTIINIREAYATISGNELNRTMKLLTMATVLIALPNVFFGMYGMNVRLPFGDHPAAYSIVVGTTFIVMIVTIWLAWRKRII
ncbi:magnesium transporter CorA family protein [Candidatus Saccharibacteria bacterium]|nr:magnesium transporter CorA family protein [Candidatus Saccharibacteria bacterium]NCU40395.1 magnesium transporter CorA family protein [Candidatus Saccharibacteria bacterium]